jgi:hypothetical protein
MSAHHEQQICRTAWTGFPDVIVQTTVNKLRSLPSYESAKRGNGEAAFEVIRQLIKPDKVPFEFDTVVPVAQFDRTYPNALPFAYAIQLAKHFEADLSLDIVQSNVVSHTKADAETRILGQPTFIGKIASARHALIVDDVVTYGSTLANLRGWIEKQGATVVGATTLAAGFGATKLTLPSEVYERLVEKFPIHAVKLANELGFTAECFTNREARFLCGMKQIEDMDRLIVAAAEMKRQRSRENMLERGTD